MKELLSWYSAHKTEIELVKNLIFFLGALGVVWSIWKFFRHMATKEKVMKTDQIKKNLRFRESLDAKLREYVFEKHKNGVEIAIRFVHWKSYPWNLEKDGFKHLLFVTQMDERTLPSGWIDNTGVFIEEPIWFFSNSLYCDKRNIFFIGDKGRVYPNFQEIKDPRLIIHLPSPTLSILISKRRLSTNLFFILNMPMIDLQNCTIPHIYAEKRRAAHTLESSLIGAIRSNAIRIFVISLLKQGML